MANFIAPAFTAVELRFEIIKSTKTQLKNKFSEIGILDRMVVEKIKSLDGEIKWPYLTLGQIFSMFWGK